jgi:hypothetical protein
MNLMKATLTKSGNILTPKGRGAYVSFFTPRGVKGDENSEPKYSVSLLIPAKADVQVMVDAVNSTIEDRWGTTKSKIKKPFLKMEDHVESFAQDEDLYEQFIKDFPFFIRCASKYKPDVLFGNGSKCEEPEEAYSGRWMRLSVRPYAWEHTMNGKGVSFGLQNAQLLDHDEKMGGGRARAEDEFDPVDVAEGGSASNVFD